MVVPQGKYNILEVVMLDYKSIVRLKRLGLNNSAIASNVHCKWDSVQRIVARCESVWGSVDGVPENLSNEEIAEKYGISPFTVKRHIQNILDKTGYENRLELAVNAKAIGLVVHEDDRTENRAVSPSGAS